MKTKVYLRVAHQSNGKTKFDARSRPSNLALTSGSGMHQEALPTVHFAIELDIPDAAFKRASAVLATIKIPEDQVEIAAEVIQ